MLSAFFRLQGLLRRLFPSWFAGPIIAMAAGLKPLTEIYQIHKVYKSEFSIRAVHVATYSTVRH